jgi:hypothetical protein
LEEETTKNKRIESDDIWNHFYTHHYIIPWHNSFTK